MHSGPMEDLADLVREGSEGVSATRGIGGAAYVEGGHDPALA